MPVSSFFKRRARRKRTIAGLLIVGLVGIAFVVWAFYGNVQQERLLTVLDPVDSAQDDDIENGEHAGSTAQFFEPAGELSVDEKKINDEQRQADLAAIHAALQDYFASNGQYPSLPNMNSNGFRQKNFPELDEATFKDPADESSQIAITRTPQEYVYAYDVVDRNGYTCEPAGRACVGYRLSAILSSGLAYSINHDD